MTSPLKTLASAFALSASIATQSMADVKIVEPIQPDDCNKLVAKGEASWYGEEVAIGRDKNGHRLYYPTANGDKFNPNLLTAAFPDKNYLGRYFLVKGLGEEVIVYVNDIGPSRENPKTKHRVIDLARGAKEVLGMDGKAQVKVYACNS